MFDPSSLYLTLLSLTLHLKLECILMTPYLTRRWSNCEVLKCLVNKSAIYWSVFTCAMWTTPCSFSLTRWQSISIRSWKTGLDAMWRAASLSQHNMVALGCLTSKSLRTHFSQVNSQHVKAMALYSASPVDLDVVVYFLDLQEAGDSPIITQSPEMDLLVSLHPAQSAPQ